MNLMRNMNRRSVSACLAATIGGAALQTLIADLRTTHRNAACRGELVKFCGFEELINRKSPDPEQLRLFLTRELDNST